MKVAIIRRRLHSYGGVEGYGLKLAHGLKDRGIDVEVIAEEFHPAYGIKFHPVKTAALPGLGPLLFNISCRRIIERERFDIVHSLERTWPQDIYRAGEGCHAEFMKTLSLKERLNPKHLVTLYAEKKAFLFSRCIMANSERVKREIMSHYGVPEGRIVLIYTGVDIERFSPQKMAPLRGDARIKLGLEKDELAILFIGSGFRRKGLAFLLKALGRLDMPLKLIVAGRGNFKRYQRLASSLGIGEKIKFLGVVKDIDSIYAAGDILVLPSLYEPFSNVCLEAMACGIPALTARANGVAEILEKNFTDLIIENPFDIEEMARKIRAVSIQNARQTISAEVRKLAESFSFSSHISEVIKLYEKVGLF